MTPPRNSKIPPTFLRLHLPSPLNSDSVGELLARLSQPDAPIPLILETPQQDYDIAEDDPSPDPYDLAMMQLLL